MRGMFLSPLTSEPCQCRSGWQARAAIRAACQDIVRQFGCYLQLQDEREIARLWNIGMGIDPETWVGRMGTYRRLVPAGELLVLGDRRVGRPSRVRISRDALEQIRTAGRLALGCQTADAVRVVANLMHNSTYDVLTCVLAVLDAGVVSFFSDVPPSAEPAVAM